MTTFAERPTIAAPRQGVQKTSRGSQFVKTITSTDHKRIGYLYLATSFAWFLIGGLLALLLRIELTRPGMQFWSNEQYNLSVGWYLAFGSGSSGVYSNNMKTYAFSLRCLRD